MKKTFPVKFFIIAGICFFAFFYITKSHQENRILRQIIERLSADSRIAEVLVTGVRTDPFSNKTYTTIKFVEYDTKSRQLPAKYFSLPGNIIQFQSLVIRFDDFYIKKGHPLKGKSAYVFMKVFSLADNDTEIFNINEIDQIPSGYKIEGVGSDFQKKLWKKFWQYALDSKEAKKMGIKNAQIEAPGTKFIPGILYTIRIEHDGGMRIDAVALPNIIRGEKID